MGEKENRPSALEMFLSKMFFYFLGALGVLILICAILSFMSGDPVKKEEGQVQNVKTGKPDITKDYLTPNPYSRSQRTLKKVKGIVIHYTANPGSSAKDNRDYFENLSRKKNNVRKQPLCCGVGWRDYTVYPLR